MRSRSSPCARGGWSVARFNPLSTRHFRAARYHMKRRKALSPTGAHRHHGFGPGAQAESLGGRYFRLNPEIIVQPERTTHTQCPSPVPRSCTQPVPGSSSPRSARCSSASAGCSAARAGIILFAGIAIVFNLVMFWFSDKLALKASRARPLEQSEAPELYRDVEEIVGQGRPADAVALPDPIGAAERVRDGPEPQEGGGRCHRGPAAPSARASRYAASSPTRSRTSATATSSSRPSPR